MDDHEVPVVETQPASYQPSTAELKEDASIGSGIRKHCGGP